MTWTPAGSPGSGTSRAGASGAGYQPRGPEPGPARAHAARGLPPGTRTAPPSTGGMRLPAAGRRREIPYVVLGVTLVVTGALGAVLMTSWGGRHVDALVLTRDVPVGHVLTVGDLRTEPVLAGATIPLVRAANAAVVVGRVTALPLRAGRLLAPDDVGSPSGPPPDHVLVAVAASSGTYPPELAPGMHVRVVTGPPDGAPPASASLASASPAGDDRTAVGGFVGQAGHAVVVAVRAAPNGAGGSVVSLLVARADADAVTAVPPSRMRLVVVPAPAASSGPSESSGSPAAPGWSGSVDGASGNRGGG